MNDTRAYRTYSDTDLLNTIERSVSCALLSLGPKTARSRPWYLLTLTTRDGHAYSFAAPSRRAVLIEAAATVDLAAWETAA